MSYTFDNYGRPICMACTRSIESHNELEVEVFPTKAIPIIFLPGILGSPLRRAPGAPAIRKQYRPTWAWFPDFPVKWVAGLFTWSRGYADLSPAERKQLLDPNATLPLRPYDQDIERDIIIKIDQKIPTNFVTNDRKFNQVVTAQGETLVSPTKILSVQEALRRGWATVMGGSYLTLLTTLEKELRLLTYSVPKTAGNTKNVSYVSTAHSVIAELFHGKESTSHGALKKTFPELDPQTAQIADYMQQIEPFLDNCRNYHYPVFAIGYNWTQSNNQSADYAFERIQKIIDYVQRQPDPNKRDEINYKPPAPGSGGLGWRCDDGVILVTHSMGGLVGRALAKKHPDLIRGVVHGVQPCDGSATLYARMKGGWEGIAGNFLAKIGDELMPVLCQSPGATELSPNQNYQAGWLRIFDGTGKRLLDMFPKPGENGQCNPYREIYLQKDAWWKLGEPALIDPEPAEEMDEDLIWKRYEDIVKGAQKFHADLDSYFHPKTYLHYGNSPKYKTWGTVTWDVGFYGAPQEITDDDGNGIGIYASRMRNTNYVPYDVVTNASVASFPVRMGSQGAAQMDLAYKTPFAGDLIAYMHRADTDGDGTVPFNSANLWQAKGRQWETGASNAAAMSDDVPSSVQYIFECKNEAFEHSESYEAKNARYVTIYSIINIIGKG